MKREYDLVVIGAGAAGMLCAGTAAEEGLSVLLLEKNHKVGRKLLITAGHHANETITSDAVWQWLFTFCNALLDGRTVCGAEARELYHNAMVYLVPLVNPDGADLASGVCAPGSPEYRAAADIAAQYPDIPFRLLSPLR